MPHSFKTGPSEVVDLYDPLTGLLSRRSFFHVVETEIEKAGSDNSRVALLIINIAGFRRVNLSAGHAIGDRVLRESADRISRAFRRRDTVARLGNDEFAALLPGMISEDHTTLAVNKILQTFTEPLEIGGHTVNLQINVGVAMYPDTSGDCDQLFRRATIALLHARDRGRAFSIYREETRDDDLTTYAHALQLRTAVDHNQLILHYQPKWDIKTGRISGLEALARWPHQDYGLLGPDRFIPIAEEGDLIQPLTAWALNESVRQCAVWHKSGIKVDVAVNLSAKVLANSDLPVMVQDALEIWSLDSEYLTLEVTETAIMTHWEQGLDVLYRLAGLGASVSIDDFGAGYSSFAYLCKLPVRELKVDKTIVNGAEDAVDNRTVLRSIIELGHGLGMSVTAEGVEDAETYRALEQLGCDKIQGYLLSRPVAAERVPDLFIRPLIS